MTRENLSRLAVFNLMQRQQPRRRATDGGSGALPATLAAGLLALCVVGWTNAATPAPSAPPSPLEVEWNTVLGKLQVDSDKFVGQRFMLRCPARTVRDADEPVFGTDRYTSDSPLCVAGVHAGAVDRAGGVVVVQLNPGVDAYAGSSRHGVQSQGFPATQRSISFVDAAVASLPDGVQRDYAPRLKWDTKFTTTGLANRDLVGQRFAFMCPAASGNLAGRRVYGTDTYAFNSYVCQAAVHAGRITHDGGFVLVQMHEGTSRLRGSIRHGIESKGGSGGSRTLTFPQAQSPLAVIGR